MSDQQHEAGSPEGLKAHDRAEGSSAEGRAVFAELCKALTTKEIGSIAAHRVLKGTRRVTRDLLEKAMEMAEVSPEDRDELWDRYFGGVADSIPEVVRRSIIRAGSVRDYGELMGLSHPTLAHILATRSITAEALVKLLAKGQQFPWKAKELETRWRHEYETYLMKKQNLNLFGARVETLFEMRPNASRTEWVERGNKPASLEHMSKNKIRILLSKLRHGEPTDWESVDRVLFGMQCSVLERVEVAHAWLQALIHPPAPRPKRVTKESGEHERKRVKPPLPDVAIPQHQIPYPTELAEKPALEIIRDLVRELGNTAEAPAELIHNVQAVLREAATLPSVPASKAEEVSEATEEEGESDDETSPLETGPNESEEDSEGVSVDEDEPTVPNDDALPDIDDRDDMPEEIGDLAPKNPEAWLFGETPVLMEDDESVRTETPDFSPEKGPRDIWQLAEYLHGFSGYEFAGYTHEEPEHAMIAAEIRRRAPLGIDDTASALKTLAYCYGRDPVHPATLQVLEAVEMSLANIPKQKLLSMMTEEPRFAAFVAYYRDHHPNSPVTACFASCMELGQISIAKNFNPETTYETPVSYADMLEPPKPAAPKEIGTKKKAGAKTAKKPTSRRSADREMSAEEAEAKKKMLKSIRREMRKNDEAWDDEVGE